MRDLLRQNNQTILILAKICNSSLRLSGKILAAETVNYRKEKIKFRFLKQKMAILKEGNIHTPMYLKNKIINSKIRRISMISSNIRVQKPDS